MIISEQTFRDSENKVRSPYTALLTWPVFLALQLSILINTHAQTPPFHWAKQAGGSGQDEGSAIAVDAVGNSYVAGYLSGNVTFGDLSFTNGGSFIAKFDNTGNLLWARQAASHPLNINGIAVDEAGNSHVTGGFSGTATFGGTTLTNSGYSDIFIAKYDSTGNVVWAKQAGGSDVDFGSAIAVDAAGNSYVTGNFQSTNAIFGSITLTNSASTNSFDIFVAKYDSTGNVVWAKQAGGSDVDFGSAIAADKAGNCLVTGSFVGTATFGSTNLISNSLGAHIFVAKYDPLGNVLWAREAGGSLADAAFGIAVDPAGNSYVTGVFGSPTAAFGDTTLINPNFNTNVLDFTGSSFDIFIAKYDNVGNVLWARQAGGSDLDASLRIAVDAAGNSYVTGVFRSPTVTFGNTTLTNNSSTNSFDIFAAKYDSAGNVLWAKQAGGSGDDSSSNVDVGVDAMGNSYVTGSFRSTNATFDSITLTNGGGYDLFVARIEGPHLSIANSGGQAIVSWPTNAAGLHLQVATNLVSPVGWMDSTNTPTVSGEKWNVTVEVTDGLRSYRLKGP